MTTDTEPSAVSQPFQAEVAELLHLMVHSVYSETDIFLRELISNASDACDKLRYEAIAAPGADQPTGSHRKSASFRTRPPIRSPLIDTGIGMDRQELIDNLGTIARSGTKSFVSRLKEAKDGIGLIGQFGVGFYSPLSWWRNASSLPAAMPAADEVVDVVFRRRHRVLRFHRPTRMMPQTYPRRGTEHRSASEKGRQDQLSRKPTRSSASSAPIPTTSSFRSNWSTDKGESAPDQFGQRAVAAAPNPNSSRKITRKPTSRSPAPSTNRR